MFCGGIEPPKTAADLNGDGQAADTFVRAKVPELANATLESFTTQVVAGAKYRFTYAGYPGEVEVWVKSWENFMEITLPDGTKISNQA
jgi:hypothetical protein